MMSKNKRGVSAIVGYIMLVAIVIAISVGVYTWMKSYIPSEALTCPDGVSVSVPDYYYNCTAHKLNFTLENSGTFSIAGYLVKATNNSAQTIATIDLTKYYSGSGTVEANAVLYISRGLNAIGPLGDKDSNGNPTYLTSNELDGIDGKYGNLTRIEITPVRYVNYKGQLKYSVCSSAKISEKVSCSS